MILYHEMAIVLIQPIASGNEVDCYSTQKVVSTESSSDYSLC